MPFQDLINPNTYQVFLFTCPAGLPISLARHPWFLINKKGVLSRYELFWRPQKWEQRWGHIHRDFYTPYSGIAIYPFTEKFLWKSITLHGHVEGDENSLAYEMITHIEASVSEYPFAFTYSFTGPNSNTYAQWILNQFPDCNMQLPWNCFGKDWKK